MAIEPGGGVERGLASLRRFLEDAPDVTRVLEDLSLPLDSAWAIDEAATLLVETDRHRVWLVVVAAAGTRHRRRLRGVLADWCREQTLSDESGRTFRPLLLLPSDLPVPPSIAAFEELAARSR